MFTINITLNICAFILMLIVLYSIFFEVTAVKNNIRSNILCAVVLTVIGGSIINTTTDFLCIYCANKVITDIFVTLSIIPTHIWIALSFYYYVSFLKEKKLGTWKVANFATVYLSIDLIILFIHSILRNPPVFTAKNVEFQKIIQSPVLSLVFICILYVFVCIKYKYVLGEHLFVALLMNGIIPIFSFLADAVVVNLKTQYFAEAISVIICCIMVQHQEIREKNITLEINNNELEDHIRQIISLNKSLNEQMNIINSMEKVYFSTYYIDVINDTFEELSSRNNIRSVVGNIGRAQETLELMSRTLIKPEFSAKIKEFTDLSTIDERLKNKDFITCDYIGETEGWSQMYLIAGDRNEKGKLCHVFCATRIIHEEKEREFEQNRALEEALSAAKAANAAKTTFLSRMSHDIRTPLNGIIGLLQIGERHPDDRELIDQNREKAKVAANHLLSLISDVLEITKMDDENVQLTNEAFSINELIQEVLTIASLRATEAGISIEIPEKQENFIEPYVYGSPLHIRQVLLNICGNAIKYNKPHGKIIYESKCLSHDETTVTYQFTIADTGIGMSEEFIKHIYEPFSQEHSDARSIYQGTGLGMSIVKTLVDKMGGQINVQSRTGEGTRFDVNLPFKIAKKEDVVQKVSAENVDINGVRILLVEDNDLNMEIAETILVDSGAIVTKAYDGQEAVDIYNKNPSASFDVILMDLMMPVLDGYGATAAIRASNKRDAKLIPIIAMTANAFSEDAKKCMDAGMNAHIAKPFNVNDLFNKIALVMQR